MTWAFYLVDLPWHPHLEPACEYLAPDAPSLLLALLASRGVPIVARPCTLAAPAQAAARSSAQPRALRPHAGNGITYFRNLGDVVSRLTAVDGEWKRSSPRGEVRARSPTPYRRLGGENVGALGARGVLYGRFP